MRHLTLTGPSAGTPFCGINKAEARQRGDRFTHLPYHNVGLFLQQKDICPYCKRVWDDAEAEAVPLT